MVTVEELLHGVNIALGNLAPSGCAAFDQNSDGRVMINELLGGVGVALGGCPPTPTPTATATVSPSATPTATPTANQPPALTCPSVYRTYTGMPIQLQVDAHDPGDRLHYTALSLPAGAQLDESTGVLSWTPELQQVGPFFASFTVTDEGIPPLPVQGYVAFEVLPRDACVLPACNPATGCTGTLVSPTESCCLSARGVRLAEPVLPCPEGAVLSVGNNDFGFGRMRDCDTLRLEEFEQASAVVRFRLRARCVNADRLATVQARMETKGRLVVEEDRDKVALESTGDDTAETFLGFPVLGPTPYYDLEGAEANLQVTLTDFDGVSLSTSLRFQLTFTDVDDLPEGADIPPPLAMCPVAVIPTPGQRLRQAERLPIR
jgi:putative Ig domain-containing protein